MPFTLEYRTADISRSLAAYIAHRYISAVRCTNVNGIVHLITLAYSLVAEYYKTVNNRHESYSPGSCLFFNV